MNKNQQLNKHLISLMQKHQVHASGYALIEDGKIFATDTISIDSEIEVSTHSLFQACSLSKPLTAYVILKLVEAGKLDLDKPINQQLKSWKIPGGEYADQITVKHCLTMTSGLCYGESKTSFPGYLQSQSIPTLQNILDGIEPAANVGLPIRSSCQPGSVYSYSGAGFMVLQKLIEDATGTAFAKFLDEQVFPSMSMTQSTFECPLGEVHRNLAVPGFDKFGEINNAGWYNIPYTASGGLWSTPSDLALFILQITKVYRWANVNFPQSLFSMMLEPQENSIFGLLSVVVDGKGESLNFRKNGHNTGYHNELLMFPNTGQGVVVMTNSANGIALINEFIDFIARQYKWPDYSTNFDELIVP
ncbi:MAG TPA: serine hydrolase [Aquella sp.]|nr:serine hydrolase [Aquella sp.]